MKKIKNAADLDSLYIKSEECDRADFAIMRTGLRLVGGEHYNTKGSRFFDRVRTASNVDENTKLRITKNHLGRIVRRYSNTIVTAAPGVTIKPKHERELQDVKAAELNQAVWIDIKEKNNWRSWAMQWADDIVGIGEVWTKVYLDQYAGEIVGYEQAVDPDGNPQFDSVGQPVGDMDRPRYKGKLCFEEVFAFNVMRDPSSQNLSDSPFFCIRKPVAVDKLKQMFPEYADKISASGEPPFLVFDAGTAGYRKGAEDEVLVKEWYIKPCSEYPKGYYYIAVTGLILDEDQLPDGIFPLVFERLESIQTKARGISVIQPLRPFQVEINRCASAIANAQITLGDDKLIMSNGSKMSAGGQVPGVRGITVSSGQPVILPGRSGSQYFEYLAAEIKGMYSMAELDEDDLQSNLDPHTLLYRAASKKRQFARYIMRMELFQKAVCETAIRMAKYYYTDEDFVSAVGRSEAVNIAEFKATKDQSLQIVVEEQTDDVETKLGRQLVLTNVLQYVGSKLDEKTIGKLIRDMPYANTSNAFADLTIDDECATNDILALDRGDLPIIAQYDNHAYMVQRATLRQRQADYRLMPPQIQQNYDAYIAAHLQMIQQEREQALRAESGFIPDGGAMIGFDFYVTDPNNPDRTRRGRVPYDAADWLFKKLQEQGTYRKIAQTMPESAIALMGQMSPDQQTASTSGHSRPVGAAGGSDVTSPSSSTLQ